MTNAQKSPVEAAADFAAESLKRKSNFPAAMHEACRRFGVPFGPVQRELSNRARAHRIATTVQESIPAEVAALASPCEECDGWGDVCGDCFSPVRSVLGCENCQEGHPQKCSECGGSGRSRVAHE